MKTIIGITAAALMGLAMPAHASDCGKVTIADMNWPSATLIANVDKFILQHGYGCEAELITGDTMPTGTSMVEKGEPDVAPEFWTNNFKAALAKGIEDKRLRIAGDALIDGGEEGFWVPDYLVKADPSLATLSGIKAKVKIFKHPEDPDASGFMTCPAGWGCQVTNDNLYKALKLEEAGFDLVDPGSGPALAGSIAKAYERQEAWFGYYWAPTAVLGKYKMVKVDFESGVDQEHFSNCLTQEVCDDPKPSMYPPSPVKTMTTEDFANRAPAAYAYLSKRGYKNAQMNELLAWMEDQQADGDIISEHFLKTHEATWSQWVPADVAAKIKKALAEL
ncbi:ABC transporter substrate-binding protein [Terasakiella sp. A23]|uniref:ABC transporter substrate-binding protein n=1 Tax=Terasakiella sp. FCG-A23 TaxID=3080561 RepID=UPI0029546DEF|nr:ABC transporter substrate-binding protein [Terasakiella sp. A23]MDV7339975.1 ABC transporter substrate-binding protein [Terasakiella sp. A23]